MPGKDSHSRQFILAFPSRPEYTFSNFVVSEGSEFAVNVVKEFCSSPDISFNTLYLFGEKGLGKTHLLISIGNHIARYFPDKIPLYIHSSEFVSNIEVGGAASDETVEKLLQVDYFLFDDVEEVSGEKKSQEKLYHIYNSLMAAGKKIAFTGQHNPAHLAATEDYLKSRFQWGMTAEIKPIDDVTTAKIIIKLGMDVGLTIPNKIIHFLLTRIPRDFLSIKNIVSRINEESFVQKKKVSLSIVKEILELS